MVFSAVQYCTVQSSPEQQAIVRAERLRGRTGFSLAGVGIRVVQ